jgi:hypothetical protein
MPTEPLREPASTYMVEDRESRDEMARLEIHDRMLTDGVRDLTDESGGLFRQVQTCPDPARAYLLDRVNKAIGLRYRQCSRTYQEIRASLLLYNFWVKQA